MIEQLLRAGFIHWNFEKQMMESNYWDKVCRFWQFSFELSLFCINFANILFFTISIRDVMLSVHIWLFFQLFLN